MRGAGASALDNSSRERTCETPLNMTMLTMYMIMKTIRNAEKSASMEPAMDMNIFLTPWKYFTNLTVRRTDPSLNTRRALKNVMLKFSWICERRLTPTFKP